MYIPTIESAFVSAFVFVSLTKNAIAIVLVIPELCRNISILIVPYVYLVYVFIHIGIAAAAAAAATTTIVHSLSAALLLLLIVVTAAAALIVLAFLVEQKENRTMRNGTFRNG